MQHHSDVWRWNGWIAEDAGSPQIAAAARRLLEAEIGMGASAPDARLEDVAAALPPSRLADDADGRLSLDPIDRIRHARGQSLPDWIALRGGRLGRAPDAVARPADAAAVRALFDLARDRGAALIPRGGGTSVVGGVTPDPDDDRPVITVATEALAGLRALDERSGLATFGSGTLGPDIETALAPRGLTLGHFPQSWERSTIGGWVAARSAGQQSIGFGRIEALFAGGHLEAPAGSIDLPPHPASAAGPDLRQLVLGSEGRFGILTDATIRVVAKPAVEAVPAWFLPDWPRAVEAAREIARAGLPLSMVRLSTPLETATLLALAGEGRSVRLLRAYLGIRKIGPEPCLLLVAASGREKLVELAVRETGSIVRRHGGTGVGGSLGRQWLRGRFRTPDVRDALWELGYAVDTLETAVEWRRLPDLATAIGRALRHTLDTAGERVHAFSHLSHVYPSGSSLYATYVFRRAADPDETLERWRLLKKAASAAIVEHGGTISHQHGVGRDHRPWLAAEKGELGLAVLGDVARRLDPDGLLNPGVLLPDRHEGQR
ncbi:MAG TPA: FAD-binding oxidoreductase [Candidatus Limnocylindrales bacterium]